MADKGYSWVVLFASCVSLALAGMMIYCSGLFHVALREHFHGEHLKTTWAGSLFASNFTLAAPLASLLMNKFNCRVTMIVSGCLFAVGFLLTAFASDINQCIFTLGIVSGIAGGIQVGPAWVVLGYEFKDKLKMACGIAGIGVGVGVFALAPIMQLVLETYSYTGFFIFMAGAGLQNVVIGALYRPSKREIERKRSSRRSPEKQRRFSTKVKHICADLAHSVEHKGLQILSMCQLLHGIGVQIVYYFLPSYCLHAGSSPMQAAWVMSTAGVAACIGRGLLGFAANSGDLEELTSYFCGIGIFGLLTTCFPFMVVSYMGQLTYAALMGTYSGSVNTLFVALVIKIVGINKYAQCVGLPNFTYGVGGVLGSVVAAKIADHGGFASAFIIAGTASLSGAVLLMAVPVISPFSRGEEGHAHDETLVIDDKTLREKSKLDGDCQTEVKSMVDQSAVDNGCLSEGRSLLEKAEVGNKTGSATFDDV